MSPKLPCPPEHWAAFSRLLDTALGLPPHERAAWLAGLPDDAAPLRAALSAVLAHSDDDAGVGLDAPRLAPVAWPLHAAGQTIGPYTLIEPLGRGGMGMVWRARRADGAYQREVALKLPHLHGGALRTRFERERDILAGLSHPHIAAFYDAGVDASGQPYLALELVSGRTITEHATGLPLGERLCLMLQVLEAVAYAHARLVAHRDIKPANVLVDTRGQVKLLDFGIAKLLDAEADPTLTREGVLATPRFAAPEQRQGGTVTVATDVFALGLMLFELLTQRSAWPSGVPLDGSAEPPLPSRTVSEAAQRRALAGDLDAIVHKALQFDAAQRYASVTDMADDLKRHQHGLPIAARRLTPWRRTLKFVRRNRLASVLGIALSVSLVAGVAAVVWQSRQAQEQARRAEAVKGFLVAVFEGADPRLAGNLPRGQTPVRTLIDRHAQRLDTDFSNDPLLRIELLRLVADLYRELGEPALAAQWGGRFASQAAQHLGADHPDLLAWRVEGLLQHYQESELARCRDAAAPLGEDIVRAGLRGSELYAVWLVHRSLCHADQSDHVDDRLRWLEQAQQLFARVAPGSRGHVTVWAEIGSLHSPEGRFEQALAAYQRALAMAEALPRRNEAELQTLHGNIGLALQQMGRLDESAQAYGRAADIAARTVGPAHRTSWYPSINRLTTLHMAGRRDEAWALLPAMQAIAQAAGDREDLRADMADFNEHVGTRMAAEGRAQEALPWLRRAVEMQARVAVHRFSHRRALRNLGDALDRAGHPQEAGDVLADALARYEAADKPANQPVIAVRERWARWLLDSGRLGEAQAQFERTVADASVKQWAHVALARAGLARVALAQGELAAARGHSAAALADWDALIGFRDVRMQAYLWRVRAAVLERDAATHAEAEALWARALEASRRTDAPDAPSVRTPRRLAL